MELEIRPLRRGGDVWGTSPSAHCSRFWKCRKELDAGGVARVTCPIILSCGPFRIPIKIIYRYLSL